jgi:5-methylcytosine-specific restriction endonuclease McrA
MEVVTISRSSPQYKKVRRSVPRKSAMARLRIKQSDRCYYCRLLMGFGEKFKKSLRRATIEHRQPVSAGGDNSFKNLVLACARCNSAKQSMMEEDFWKMINAREIW